MRNVVIDLDNTIAIYDKLIVDACSDLGVPVPKNHSKKDEISKFLKNNGMNDFWTTIQGLIYGPKMCLAEIAAGFLDTATFLKDNGFNLFLVSHKTKFPASGLDYNLHNAALNWIEKNVSKTFDEIFFEDTQKEKVKRINKINPFLLIDDLEEIHLLVGLPRERSILIHCNSRVFSKHCYAFADWGSVLNYFKTSNILVYK